MLKRVYRLPASQKPKNATYFKSAFFSLRITKNNLANNRYGFVVKKALDKRAVVRNRIRRVFRSSIEEMNDDIKNGYDMLFVLEKGIIGKVREEVFRDLDKFLTEKKLK
jgi:ribonuclease P protein component